MELAPPQPDTVIDLTGTVDVLGGVRAIGPQIAASSEAIEKKRSLTKEVVELVKPTGAFRMWVPSDLNGPQIEAWGGLEVLEELAYHDGATGWCTMISSTSSLMASFLPDEHAREMFDTPDAIACGFAMPRGRALPVEGGLRVSGTWEWGSFAHHATWIAGGAWIVDEHGERSPRADGLRGPYVFFRADEVEVLDNWHSSGLCGTGSGDYRVTDVFVPEGRWVEMLVDKPRRVHPLSRFSFYGLLAGGVAACAVGIARRSIDELVALADKKPQGSRRTLGERSATHADVGIAEAKLGAAWALMRQTVADTWASAEAGQDPTDEQKRLLRMASTHATQTAAEVAELMYKAGGGASVYKSHPLQRCFRDAFVATQHAMVAPRMFETIGSVRFGADPTRMRF